MDITTDAVSELSDNDKWLMLAGVFCQAATKLGYSLEQLKGIIFQNGVKRGFPYLSTVQIFQIAQSHPYSFLDVNLCFGQPELDLIIYGECN